MKRRTYLRAVTHPLDPLTADEITTTVGILRNARGLGDETRFVEIVLREPEKDELARYERGEAVPREASVILLNRSAETTYEAVVSLGEDAVQAWRPVPGVQAAITLEEYFECEQASARRPSLPRGPCASRD